MSNQKFIHLTLDFKDAWTLVYRGNFLKKLRALDTIDKRQILYLNNYFGVEHTIKIYTENVRTADAFTREFVRSFSEYRSKFYRDIALPTKKFILKLKNKHDNSEEQFAPDRLAREILIDCLETMLLRCNHSITETEHSFAKKIDKIFCKSYSLERWYNDEPDTEKSA